ncbi:MAG: DNA translocase FtsK, partial [Candidatus Babeliales bacterium]|nr:DNA translocase FtsK [Candidatus Babeliales bacterium]
SQSGLLNFRHEFIGCALLACALFLGLSLGSYYPHDSSWFYYSSVAGYIHNMGGAMGAHVAALLFYLLGSSALGIVFLLFFIAYLTFAKIPLMHEWERLGAGFVGILVVAALLHLYSIDFLGASYPGGLFGGMVYARLVNAFGASGAFIFLNTLLIICFILITRLSFIICVQFCVKVLALIFSKRFFVPCYYFLRISITKLTVPLRSAVQFLKKLYDGAVIDDEQYCVNDFEQALLHCAEDQTGLDSTAFNEVIQKFESTASQSGPMVKNEFLVPTVIHERAVVVQSKIVKVLKKAYALPHLNIFAKPANDNHDAKLNKELENRAKILEEKLARFGVSGTVTSIKRGPVVTLFEYQPHIDTKVSKIIALEDDLALALQAMSIRIIAPIPGRSVVGFEVANTLRKDVVFSKVAQSSEYEQFKGGLPLILGQNTIGANVVVDMARMPHLLVAGSTGSGKSVALNAMLISLLCKCRPDQLRLILIDPKRLEFASYADIPHLLFPIITESKRATLALRWVVKQMEDRYTMMAACGARNFTDYNGMVGLHEKVTEPLPYIVVVIDELADLMMTSGRDIEDLIARIAQMARAAGIHMIVATQRPSVDVITGLIKVNFPSRISFRVTSKIDSRTILDCGGADKLLGRGDMLFLDAGGSTLCRVHGAYVSDKEIADVVAHARSQQAPGYLDLTAEIGHAKRDGMDEEDDQMYADVVSFIKEIDEVSISLLQRKFRIGFNRSARIIEQLESQGLIMSMDGGKTRKVLR